jgi:imidazolonepropionase-like amidohydrolase
MDNAITAITNVKIFDGEQVINGDTVVIKDDVIISVGQSIPANSNVIDGIGCMLLPGLIDAHTHPNIDSLKLALSFGVTTTFQMQGWWTTDQVKEISERRDIADCLKSFMAIGAPDGHPNELLPPAVKAKQQEMASKIGATIKKDASTPDEAKERVVERCSQGADYIKLMIEDGRVFGHSGTPDLSDDVINAACVEAHKNSKMAVAHTMTVDASTRAINGGIDGLMHLFIDQPYTNEIISAIKNSGVFVCPTIVAGASTIGDSDAADFARDTRVALRLPNEWQDTLHRQIATFPQGNINHLLATVKALHDAGVEILAGTDASQPAIGGMVHGASLHHELQLLVRAGLTPLEALRAATSIPARRFGLLDRGKIVSGARADLLLVEGNPVENISDTLNIVSVWRQGVKQ